MSCFRRSVLQAVAAPRAVQRRLASTTASAPRFVSSAAREAEGDGAKQPQPPSGYQQHIADAALPHGRMSSVQFYDETDAQGCAIGGIHVSWQDGSSSCFDATWLRLAGKDCFHTTSQRLVNAQDLVHFPSHIETAVIDQENNTIVLTFVGEPSPIVITGDFMRRNGHRVRRDERKMIMQKQGKRTTPKSKEDLTVLPYGNLKDDASSLYRLMQAICEDGVAIISEVPNRDKAVGDVAGLIAPPIDTLYGKFFDVVSVRDPINLAYTGEALRYHMDLAYYDSPPGIQCLHCRAFSEEVQGGQSTFLDAHAAAELLRERHPEHFATLARVPAKFQKDHLQRENPAQFFFERPHIVTQPGTEEVLSVFWSPPFEGMVAAPHTDMLAYYKAYRAFSQIVDAPETSNDFGAEFRLSPGEMVIFNNRRYLHGRQSFNLNGGHRHLEGCYLSLDDFMNRFHNLSLEHADPSYIPPRIGTADQS